MKRVFCEALNDPDEFALVCRMSQEGRRKFVRHKLTLARTRGRPVLTSIRSGKIGGRKRSCLNSNSAKLRQHRQVAPLTERALS